MKKRAPPPTAQTKTVPAPVRGLNFKDALAAMRETDALVLDNIVCRSSYLECRKGWDPHVTGITGTVETLMRYSKTDGTQKIFGCAGTAIYDVSTAGAVGAAVVSGLTNAYWAYTQVSNTAGNFLLCVNGADSGRSYDGTTWSAWGVTGIASTSLNQLCVWKRRVLAVEKNTFKMWYLAADAITGAASAFNFSGVFTLGGYLVALIPWTIDGGVGADDYLLAVTSEGEVAIYKGTDPSTAADFELVGNFFIGKPVGKRFYTRFGGDVMFLTTSGVISISGFLQSSGQTIKASLSDRILPELSKDIRNYGTTQGWELHYYHDYNLLFIQVPDGAVGNRSQWAMDTLSKAWSKLAMADIVTLAVLNGVLYGGQSTQVSNAWTGGTDNGEAIQYTMVPAFSYFGMPTNSKKFELGRISFEADVTPSYKIKLLRDFNQLFSLASQVASAVSGDKWGTAVWGTSKWLGYIRFYRPWSNLNGSAYSATVVVQGVHQGTTLRIYAVDYVYGAGGILGS